MGSSGGSNDDAQGGGPRRLVHANAIDTMLYPLRWLLQTRPQIINPTADARRFIQEFDDKYSPTHSRFHDNAYSSAVAQAHQSSRFLIVYLHSPLHEDSDKFCRQVLCTRNVSRLLDEHAVTWAGKVLDPEAYELSSQFRVSAFPFLAILVCNSASRVDIVDRIQGFLDERELTERLQQSLAANHHALNAVREHSLRREETSSLRAQQDRDFQESQARDRREAERRQREARDRAQQVETARHEREQQEAQDLRERQARDSDLARKKAALREPEAGPSVAMVRFQLPQGAKVSRRFDKKDSLQSMCDFLEVHFAETQGPRRFVLCTHFPKVELADMAATVDELVSFSLPPCPLVARHVLIQS